MSERKREILNRIILLNKNAFRHTYQVELFVQPIGITSHFERMLSISRLTRCLRARSPSCSRPAHAAMWEVGRKDGGQVG